MSSELLEKIRLAGVVGAGGASFPTYIKLASKVNTIIVNASECEPLLYTDKTALLHYTDEVLQGLKTAMEITDAKEGIVAVKGKNKELIEVLRGPLKKYSRIEVKDLGDYYPAGDEQTLVYEVTGKIIPEGGLPPNVGVTVQNVTTLQNVYRALKGIPVTERILTVHGEVNSPMVLRVPVGTKYRDLIEFAGGTKLSDPVILDGGPMMGEVKTDLDDSISKGCAGIIVLSKEHPLILKKSVTSLHQIVRTKSVCDQCQLCTDMCPRYLLGHNLYPHKVMRTINYEREIPTEDATQAYLCCFCNICYLYACPTSISPSAHLRSIRDSLAKNGIKNPHNESPESVREFFDSRKILTGLLTQKLGLSEYSKITPTVKRVLLHPSCVKIKLKQHPGKAAVPTVRVGAHVSKGDLIGTTVKGDFSVPVHASISGKVDSIDSEKITIVADP